MVEDKLVVTYIVVTEDNLGFESFDVHPDESHNVDGTAPDHTAGVADPTGIPTAVEEREVVHHAIHHLALLAMTNPSIKVALRFSSCQALLPLVPEGAGVLPRLARVTRAS